MVLVNTVTLGQTLTRLTNPMFVSGHVGMPFSNNGGH